jgi:hypothetical protein
LIPSGNELKIRTASEFRLAVKSPDVEAAVRQILGRPLKVVVEIGQVSAVTPAQAPKAANQEEDELTARALSHPEVKRFQELFPDSQVRTIRDLKEST